MQQAIQAVNLVCSTRRGAAQLAQSLVRGTTVSSSRFPSKPRRGRDPAAANHLAPHAYGSLHHRPMIRVQST